MSETSSRYARSTFTLCGVLEAILLLMAGLVLLVRLKFPQLFSAQIFNSKMLEIKLYWQ